MYHMFYLLRNGIILVLVETQNENAVCWILVLEMDINNLNKSLMLFYLVVWIFSFKFLWSFPIRT